MGKEGRIWAEGTVRIGRRKMTAALFALMTFTFHAGLAVGTGFAVSESLCPILDFRGYVIGM